MTTSGSAGGLLVVMAASELNVRQDVNVMEGEARKRYGFMAMSRFHMWHNRASN
jgi:hypothetical protein